MTETPVWVLEGRVIEMAEGTAPDDLERACPDSPFILEPEEYDLEWRVARMPLSGVVGAFADMDAFLEAMHDPYDEELARVNAIREAIKKHGGPEAFAAEFPGIATWDESEGAELLDGWHRAAIFWFDHELTDMPVAVGLEPQPKPKP